MNRRTVAGTASLLAALLIAATLTGTSADAHVNNDYKRLPTNDEYALLVLANMERAPGKQPFVWHDGLATAARYHSYDMVQHPGCYGHDNCLDPGEAYDITKHYWSVRVRSFYAGGSIGEVVTDGGSDPRTLHRLWMESDPHRAKILSSIYDEFGAGIAAKPDVGFGDAGFGTEDFGTRGAVSEADVPMIPAATVLPREAPASTQRELLVSAFHPLGVTSVKAFANGTEVAMPKLKGTAKHGTYRAYYTFPSATACVPLYFVATQGTTTFRWPATGSILVGVNRLCAERTDSPATTSTSSTTTTTTTQPTNTTTPGSGAVSVVIDSLTQGQRIAADVEVQKITAHAVHSGNVAKLDVYVDGKRLVRVGSDEVSRNWLIGQAAYAIGPHTIVVRALNAANQTLAEKTITVFKE